MFGLGALLFGSSSHTNASEGSHSTYQPSDYTPDNSAGSSYDSGSSFDSSDSGGGFGGGGSSGEW